MKTDTYSIIIHANKTRKEKKNGFKNDLDIKVKIMKRGRPYVGIVVKNDDCLNECGFDSVLRW